jgi:flagellar hook-length control protein FliK
MLLAVADVPLPIAAQRVAAVTTDEPAGDALVSVSAGVTSTIMVADGGGEMMSATAVPTATEAATPPAARVSLHAEPASSTPLAIPASEIAQVEAVVPATVTSDAATSAQPEKTAVTVADESTARQLSGGSVAPQASESSVDKEAAAGDSDGATTVVAMPGADADVGYGDAEDPGDNAGERFAGSGPGQASATAGHAAASGRFEIPRNDAEALRSPTAQLAAPVARAAKAGVQRVEIALEPAALGRVDVRLDFAPDGRVSAFFVADNRQALDALRADAQTLARALSDAGVDAGGLGFGLRHREPGSDGGSFASTFGRSGGEPGKGSSAATDVVGHPESLFRSGSSGRLDIRA